MFQLPRVPMQGLSNVVPPQDPDHIPTAAAAAAATSLLPVSLHQQPGKCPSPLSNLDCDRH